MPKNILLVGCGLAIAMLSCRGAGTSQDTHLTPRVLALSPSEMFDTSDLILVGRVDGISLKGPSKRSAEGFYVQHVAASVRVESVLFGNESSQWVTVHGFVTPDGHLFSGPAQSRLRFESGRHYVLLLRRDGIHLRTVTDLFQSQSSLCADNVTIANALSSGQRNARMIVARLLLTPGPGCSSHDFSVSLFSHVAFAKSITNQNEVNALLRGLLASPELEVSSRACLLLARETRQANPCLKKIVRSYPQDDLLSREASEILMQGFPAVRLERTPSTGRQ